MFFETNRQTFYPPPSTARDQLDYSTEKFNTMATHFAMPAQPFNTSPSQYTLYSGQSQQVSPTSSNVPTPHNASPTSPRSGLQHYLPAHTRQLRPPKSPLYIPAVLRPTDPPKRLSKPSPLTPPQSMHSSFDDLENASTLTRSSTGDSGKFGLGAITEAEWNVEGLGKVTALPTRNHWKPDSQSSICDEATCTRYFSYFTRRHHCRRCGNIFCDQHSTHTIPLDQDANYHPQGTQSRACQHCFNDYKRWSVSRSSRSNSESSQDEPGTPTTPVVNCARGRAIGNILGQQMKGTPESLGASVPRDWNWSTF